MRTNKMTVAAVVVAAAALTLAGCSSSGGGNKGGGGGGLGGGNSASSSGGGSGSTPTYTIGFEGPLSGANAQPGINEEYGVELAVDQANAGSSLGFKLQLTKSDDEGDPAKSPAACSALVTKCSSCLRA